MKFQSILLSALCMSALVSVRAQAVQPGTLEIEQPVAGYAYDFETPNADQLAHNDYVRACSEFRRGAFQQLGRALLYINCGAPVQVGRRYHQQFASQSLMDIALPGEPTIINDELFSAFFPGRSPAAQKARLAHENVCAVWTRDIQHTGGVYLVYHICGAPERIGSASGYQYHSVATGVLYIRANMKKITRTLVSSPILTIDGLAAGQMSFARQCQQFKALARKTYGNHLVVAVCGKAKKMEQSGATFFSSEGLIVVK